MQTVIEHIAGYGITETIEKVGAHGDGCHIKPSLVVNEVGELMERELLGTLRLEAFLGKETANQGHHGCRNTKDSTDNSILMSSRTAYHFLKIRKREQGDETHRISSHHAEGRELILLVIVLGHHTEQRTVRHIHHGINRHHQQIEGVGIDALAHRSKIRGIEQERENQSERNGTIDEPRAIGAEATLGTVGKGTHQRVGNHIKHTSHQHQYGSIGKRESEDIGKEERKGDRHHLPYDAARSGITQRISNFFFYTSHCKLLTINF